MRRNDPQRQVQRAAARRLGANWTELHRQEEEAARASPLHSYVRSLPWLVGLAAVGGVVNLAQGVTLTLGQLLALGAVGTGAAVAGGVAWWRHRRARAPKVIYERPAARRVRDRTT